MMRHGFCGHPEVHGGLIDLEYIGRTQVPPKACPLRGAPLRLEVG